MSAPLIWLVREPLSQFLALGIAVFALYGVMTTSGPDPIAERVEVSSGRIAHLQEVFSKTWQRPPTPVELEGLVQAYVREEIFYREAQKLGLDRDDTVVRRRLQQKMEFLIEPSAAELEPTYVALRKYFEANAGRYRSPPRVAFRQIFLDPRKRSHAAGDAEALLQKLKASRERIEAAELGDVTLLPHDVGPAPVGQVAGSFGKAFADALMDVEPGKWFGPIQSTYGLHLIFLSERLESETPELAAVQSSVLRDWQNAKRKEISDERYKNMRERYQVKITWPDGADVDIGAERQGK